jgi:AraC-like DNA-binding protein
VHLAHLLVHQRRIPDGADWRIEDPSWHFARIRSGNVYALAHTGVKEAVAGSLVVNAGAPLELRSSQLAAVDVDSFRLDPALVFGVFTLMERRLLDHPETATPPLPWILPAQHTASLRFAAVTAGPLDAPLAQRARLLEVVASAIEADRFPSPHPIGYQLDAGERLNDLLHRLTEAELLAMSPDQLAEECHCERRRVLQIFRERFGISLPAQQAEWMRQRACTLLSQPDMPISEVARACGYPQPEAFRAWFRRQFGKPPAKWRRDLGHPKAA